MQLMLIDRVSSDIVVRGLEGAGRVGERKLVAKKVCNGEALGELAGSSMVHG